MSIPGSIRQLAPLLQRREISPLEITRICLERIDKLNSALNAFITVMADSALAEARAAEAEIGHGEWRGPLHGVPVALKDLICTAGIRTTAATAVLADHIPTEDAEVVRRLREAGAVIVGKNNLHEFAYGGSSLISHFGVVHNPRNLDRIAGGSSGGSAAAVAAGLCYAAIGTDTAGSIREPAALSGCVGFKPTYGRVSTRGVLPLSWSLDHVGPLASTVADAAIVLQAIAGYDRADTTTADVAVADYVSASEESAQRLRVGTLRSYFCDDLDSEVATAFEEAVVVVKRLVAATMDLDFDVPTDRTVQTAEAYAYHAERVSSTPDLYLPETVRRIQAGAAVSAAEYIQRRRELDKARRGIRDAFATVDVLITPTIPMPAPKIDDLLLNPDDLRPAELKLLRNTRPFNVWGLPAISVPCGFTSTGLPIGLQIAGPPWREDLVLRVANAYQEATAWHKRKPELSEYAS